MPPPHRTPPPASRWRLAAPALAAASLPLAARAVGWLGGGPVPEPRALAVQALWAAFPLAFLGGLAAVEPRVRPAFGLAAAVGLAITAAGWAWVAAAGSGGTLGEGLVAGALPIGVVSVMVTVVAVRSAFSGPPPPSGPPRGR